MISFVLFALVLTPILGAPPMSNEAPPQDSHDHHSDPHHHNHHHHHHTHPSNPQNPLPPPKALLQVQVPIEPDALVVPYPNRYSHYQNIITRTSEHYYPEPVVVVPLSNLPKIYHPEYESSKYPYYPLPRLVYYLPYGQTYQQEQKVSQIKPVTRASQQYNQQQQQHEQQQQQQYEQTPVAQKTVQEPKQQQQEQQQYAQQVQPSHQQVN